MKAILVAMVLSLSVSTLAKTSAMEGAKALITSGTYLGQKCKVTVEHTQGSSFFKVDGEYASDSFSVVNTPNSTGYTAVYSPETKELTATLSLRYPGHYNGGSKHLYVKNEGQKVTISVSQVLLDVRGNDRSTFATCTFSK